MGGVSAPGTQGAAALITPQQENALRLIELGMQQVGYSPALRRRDYVYADFFADELGTRTVDLTAFAREPFSYDTACIAAACANGERGAGLVTPLRGLGAPLAFEVSEDGSATRWQVTGVAAPRQLDTVPPGHIRQAFGQHRGEWNPGAVFRAKCIPQRPEARQLDFFDLGLMPAIGEAVSTKLRELLEAVVANAVRIHEDRHNGTPPDYAKLFALVFRFIAAKVLGDRGYPGDWLPADARTALDRVDVYYFGSRPGPPGLADRQVQDVIWDRIRSAFHFQNVSADALAYIYEDTLVTPEARRIWGTHSTPPRIAEYLVRHLPFEDLPIEDLHVLEPCAGHGVFLVAAMRRMRELLPPATPAQERHEFFVSRLAGIEVDPFACEVARLSLMLADYPNPDDWRILRDDVFAGDAISREMQAQTVVLCNPPFEDFTAEESARYSGTLEYVAKPAEVLARVLNAGPPAMLGFVLPRAFLTGRRYRAFHEDIGSSYRSVELVALPDRVFRHSDAEAALLLAWDRTTAPDARCQARSSVVFEAGRHEFRASGAVSWSRDELLAPRPGTLWTTPSQDVWDRLAHLQTLGEVADVHRGIEFSVPLDDTHLGALISLTHRPGFVKGLHTVRQHLDEAFVHRGHVWLNTAEGVMRGNAHHRPWGKPKVIVNAATVSRGPWRIVACPNASGLVCYQNFHGVWPKPAQAWSVRGLAAVLNGPVANAYLRDHEGKRHNRAVTLKAVPLPRLASSTAEVLDSLVAEYLGLRGVPAGVALPNQRLAQLRACLRQIDALVLEGYDLPPRLERKLLDQFSGHPRPVPFPFSEFFPADLTACIPYHEFVSESFQRASAQATLERLQPIRDQAIHEAMEHLRWLGGEEE